jgi:16S rRNA (guanine527-N7)-methyltransferase
MKQSTGSIDNRLQAFADLLLLWTEKINLIGRADRDRVWERHIDDSLQLVPLLPPHLVRAIDLGSGGGFPGLILSIATGIHFDLVESDQRKAAFLREAARVTLSPVTVHCTRIEGCRLPPADLVTARALAPLPRLLPLAAPFLHPDATLLLLKGESADAELTAAAREWQMQLRRTPSVTHPSASILQITGLRRVPLSGND